MIESILSAIAETVFGHLIHKTDTLSRIKDQRGLELAKLAYKIALGRAYKHFKSEYPEFAKSLFEEDLLETSGAPILVRLLERGSEVIPSDLATIWSAQLGGNEKTRDENRIRFQEPASFFLESLDSELRKRDEIRTLFVSRDFDQMAQSTNEMRRQIDVLTDELHQLLNEISGLPSARIDGDTLLQILVGAPPSFSDHLLTFGTLIDARTRDFVGRKFLFDHIEQTCKSPDFPSGYIHIVGEPGIGKTSFMAAFVKRFGALHHFNISSNGITSPQQFLGNICAQLIVRYVLPYKTLPRYAAVNSSFLERLLSEVSSVTGGQPIFILADALDEASRSAMPSTANPLYLPRILPDNVYFVVTSRPDDSIVLTADHIQMITIEDIGSDNMTDVHSYIDRFIEAHVEQMQEVMKEFQVTRDDFREVIATRSSGNFMYLEYVLRDILSRRLNPSNLDDIKALPKGLENYYKAHWKRMNEDEHSRKYQLPILGLFAATGAPNRISDLVMFTGFSPIEIGNVVRTWRPFLEESEKGWQIYHPSFLRFIEREINLDDYRDIISRTIFGRILRNKNDQPA